MNSEFFPFVLFLYRWTAPDLTRIVVVATIDRNVLDGYHTAENFCRMPLTTLGQTRCRLSRTTAVILKLHTKDIRHQVGLRRCTITRALSARLQRSSVEHPLEDPPLLFPSLTSLVNFVSQNGSQTVDSCTGCSPSRGCDPSTNQEEQCEAKAKEQIPKGAPRS